MFLERSFELPVCTRLSDTKPLTCRVWDMLVDLNLYVQTINHRPYEFSRQHRFMRYWINHNAAVKNKTVQPVPMISTSVRAQNPRRKTPGAKPLAQSTLTTQAGSVLSRVCWLVPGELARDTVT